MDDSTILMNKTLKYLPKRHPVDIEFQDLSFSVPDGRKSTKMILKNINGKFGSGQVTAILGPSGGGKSSLLNILAGYKTEGSSGNIFVNGGRRELDRFVKISRYIMQDDHVQPYLTVQESMEIAANLKLGSHETKESKHYMIEEILDLLNLIRTKNTLVKKLSGGERKRVSVALELLNNPPVIFLDEPTTGLDDVACSQCIGLLKLLASGGRTVICSLHTPSAKLFSVFDNIYILSAGQCAYQGIPSGIVPYLANIGLVCPLSYNPADFVLEVCNQEYGDFQSNLVDLIENGLLFFDGQTCNINQKKVLPPNEMKYSKGHVHKSRHTNTRGSTSLEQISILIRRFWIQIWRNKSGIFLRTFIHLFLGLLISNVYIGMGNDGSKTLFNFGFFYVVLIFFMFVPMVPFLMWIPMEIKILKREHFNGWYGLGSYYLALTFANLPVQMILTMIFIALTYTISGQPMELRRIVLFYTISVLTAMVAESYGIIMGVIFNIVNSLFLGTSFKVPLMLLATYGYGSGSESIPRWIKFAMYFDYLRYSMEGYMDTMLNNRKLIPCPETVDWCIYTDVSFFIRSMGMEDAKIWVDIAALVIFLVLFRAVGFYLLKQRMRPNKLSKLVYFLSKLVKSHFGA